ncbi:MAG: NFACT family protein, partial [Clostridia bacterium]|nr:NFACT family protein [Clostridia bacterium]
EYPAISERLNPTDFDEGEVRALLFAADKSKTVERFITSSFSGVAIQIARELCYRATGGLDAPLYSADNEVLISVLTDWRDLLRENRCSPTLAKDSLGTPKDYSYMNITYLGADAEYVSFGALSGLLDSFFAERDRLEKITQRARDLKNIISSAIARTERKLELQRKTLLDCERAEEYRRTGDLITANLFRIPKGAETVEVVDYYDEACPTVTVTLDKRLSATANAAKFYKLYTKAKTARRVLCEQIIHWEGELRYLESVGAFLEACESEADIADIREELYSAGYGRGMKGYKPRAAAKPRPLVMTTSGGFTLLVGRNNIENDRLTFKIARKEDLWFHTKDYPGSHVILVTEGKEPSETDYTEACQIAAGHSSARTGTVAVDYTRVKNIKKPPAARAGFVTYSTNYTAYVRPRRTLDGGE